MPAPVAAGAAVGDTVGASQCTPGGRHLGLPGSICFVLGLPVVRASELTVTVTPAPRAGLRRVVLTVADFRLTAADARWHTRWVPTGRDGTVTVAIAYRDTAGAVLAQDTLRLPARPRWFWSVHLGLLYSDPQFEPPRCNCDGEHLVPLCGPNRPAGADFMRVTWDGHDADGLPSPPR